MNEKMNIQDLIDMLAEKHGMSKKNAESFTKEFFQLIEEALEKDKYVKIKGLGTFKLIDVESRESVNVNTGERFQIQGHTKVSFTPEPTLKDIINKPFSHFETVVLNDDTVLEDTPLENDNEEDEEADSKVSETKGQELVVETVSEEVIAAPEEAMPSEQENNTKEEMPESEEAVVDVPVTSTPETVIEKESKNEPVSAVDRVALKLEQQASEVKEPVDSSAMKYFIGIVVFVVLLCGGAVAFMYYPDLLDKLTTKQPAEEVADSGTNEPIEKNETALMDSVIAEDVIEPVKVDTVAETLAAVAPPQETPKEVVPKPAYKEEQKKPAAAPFEPDSVDYTIVGTETTYTIKEGETLTKVALRFYGTKALWPYLVKHNPDVIKNPDNVPYGTTIKIPKLAKKQ
ncbi:HU family DNA-binding protein [Bacteroides sp. GD17]|jgi:nucleoid DNA-binding protein|uniref:HU family DNA-binding protein n=1 Tax=Bacteroides sp. GD17 TaxID=3139826 RepID=UPI0025FE73CE|nr:HU family DNA-binding protein [uncultured Bacteroides sp.]